MLLADHLGSIDDHYLHFPVRGRKHLDDALRVLLGHDYYLHFPVRGRERHLEHHFIKSIHRSLFTFPRKGTETSSI